MKLLGERKNGERLTRYYQDWDGGKKMFTVLQTEDVAPVMKRSKILKEIKGKDKEFRYKASIPRNVFEEACKLSAAYWGVTKADAFREITSGRTDRAKKVLMVLTEGRDFRKFQGA